jgi:hypothetical protein
MEPLPDKDALTTLLSVESLLLAASTLAVTISRTPIHGQEKTAFPKRAAWGVAWLILVVSVGAGAAWTELFVCGDGPGNVLGWIEAGALLAILLVLPVIGFVVATWAK